MLNRVRSVLQDSNQTLLPMTAKAASQEPIASTEVLAFNAIRGINLTPTRLSAFSVRTDRLDSMESVLNAAQGKLPT